MRDQSPNQVEAYIGPSNHITHARSVVRSELSPDGQRLLSDILVSIEAECWKDLTVRMGAEIPDPDGIQVFISYRERPDIEQFAEAVALRLETESIRARFDKWDMLAGDSLTGKIDEAFAASRACIIVLSSDFTAGRWATTEMNTAITKRVDEGYQSDPGPI